jgi:hypothetical protein
MNCLFVFNAIFIKKQLKSLVDVFFAFSLPDIMDILFGLALDGFWHLVQDIGCLMNPTPLVTGLRPNFFQSPPKSHCSIPNGKLRRNGQTSCLQIQKKFTPALGTFPIAIQKAYQFLFPSGIAAIITSMHFLSHGARTKNTLEENLGLSSLLSLQARPDSLSVSTRSVCCWSSQNPF